MVTTTASTAGRWARLLLLVGTLFGLATMHTLGHGTHPAHAAGAAAHGGVTPGEVADHGGAASHGGLADRGGVGTNAAVDHGGVVSGAAVDHGGVAPGAAVGRGGVAFGPAVATVDLPGVAGCPGGCPVAGFRPGDGGGQELPAWGVCLAVLGALAVSLLLIALPQVAARAVGPPRPRGGRAVPASRAPPLRPIALRLATVSVLRR